MISTAHCRRGNMQEFGFIQATGKTKRRVLGEKTESLQRVRDANGILTYMYLMLDEAKKNNISLTRESFSEIRQGCRTVPRRKTMVFARE